MFKEFAQITQMLGQVRQLSGRMGELQQRLADLRIRGESLDGRVLVELTGQGQMVRCQVAPDLLDPAAAPALERAVIEATNIAQQQVREAALREMGDAAGGLDLASLAGKLPGFGT